MQGCRGNTEIGHDQSWDVLFTYGLMKRKKKSKFIIQHVRKQSRSLHHGNTKDSSPIPFSVHIWSDFQHMAGSAPRHLQHARCPTTQHGLSLHLSSDGQLSFQRETLSYLLLTPNSFACTSHCSDEGSLEVTHHSFELPRGMLTASFWWLLLNKYQE